MATPVLAQMAGAASLLAGATWMAPAFVPAPQAKSDTRAISSTALRGSASHMADPADAAKTQVGAGALLGLTAAAVAVHGVRKQRRQP
eukprot:CAMPEP_0197869902 /NCGR_PEP_ID=MMETSP1439-20131203/692_1 /TAXON_ID=66791 /ORGANISM="Gonyaulax spinifera, Strain CCMP409" /LENGTH=87 /DNA_ID=CAMNT_0043488765 /DNA_START=57 /DNA_END=317 /DNA_ORIENTATION=-